MAPPLPGQSAAPEAPPHATRTRVADAAVLLTLAWWATFLTWGSGGQGPHLLSVQVVLTGVALALVRPWRRVHPAAVSLLLGLGLAAYGVALTAPTGWAGANEAGSYATAGLLALLLLGWVDGAARRQVVLGALLAAALMEFAKGFVQWWASGTTEQVFVGTFYWHNQAAAFLLVGVCVGLPILAAGRSALRSVAWVAVPLCGAGVVLSTSRAGQMGLFLAFGAVLLAVLLQEDGRWRSGLRVVAAAVLVPLSVQVLSGPLFFSERSAVGLGGGTRGEDLVSNGVYRLDFWRQAWEVFGAHPLSGAGFHSFAGATSVVVPDREVSSAFAHNGYLQVLSDGGLLLFLPVLAALSWVGLASVRRAVPAVRTGSAPQTAPLLALVVLLLHSGMDFDWSYPSLVLATAMTAVLAAGPASTRAGAVLSDKAVATPVVALIGLSALTAWHGLVQVTVHFPGAS